MGGDHKCPVCQATFTRPQHVARHMRSHTGDRPYKCQHCGDQFARSDLLSRHVNKCHATEKPAQAQTNNRRKGSASASRATTSKQACDQCVQSSLPCDGCNPCSKCVQRKCRCTFVKFHRQTAPSGPGHHNPRPASSSSSLSSSSRMSAHSHVDDFILGPPPLSVPSMSTSTSTDPLFASTFAFNPAYPSSTTDAPHLSLSMATDSDMVAKYRAQAELLRRAGNSMLSNPQSTAAVIPGLYTNPSQPSSTNWFGWNEGPSVSSPSHSNVMADVPLNHRYMPIDDKDIHSNYNRNFPSDRDAPQFAPGSAGSQHQFQNDMFSGNMTSASAYRPRKGSLDFSDGGSATSHSVPSSAASSNVHLPLGGNEMFHGASNNYQQHQTSRMLLGQDQRNRDQFQQQQQQHQQSQPPTSQRPQYGEGGFSSAFGLMSIDDPNVLAGLSNDGVPFFSHMSGMQPHSPNATPMPSKPVQHSGPHTRDRPLSAALPTPGSRDAEMRELRDFWRAYMRTPLSSSGTSGLDAAGALLAPGGPASPAGQRRRARVSSLPSVKTPTVEHTHARMGNGHAVGPGEGTSGLRTTLHGNAEDLRSYEAAVNARNSAMKLNLVPKRRGTRPSMSASPPVPPSSAGPYINGPGMNANVVPGFDFNNMSRPSSSSSTTSSLANAFGSSAMRRHHPHPHQHHPHAGAQAGVQVSATHCAPPMHASSSLPPPAVLHTHMDGSRESSVVSEEGAGSSDGDMMRPSFKRLPSQTLGPANPKRALLARGVEGGDGMGMEGVKHGDTLSVPTTNGNMNGVGMGGESGPVGARPMVGLPERHRRASEANAKV